MLLHWWKLSRTKLILSISTTVISLHVTRPVSLFAWQGNPLGIRSPPPCRLSLTCASHLSSHQWNPSMLLNVRYRSPQVLGCWNIRGSCLTVGWSKKKQFWALKPQDVWILNILHVLERWRMPLWHNISSWYLNATASWISKSCTMQLYGCFVIRSASSLLFLTQTPCGFVCMIL